MTKVCNKCKAEKNSSEFYIHKRTKKSGVKLYLESYCKDCFKQNQNEYRKNNIEEIRKKDRERVSNRTPEQVEKDKQQNKLNYHKHKAERIDKVAKYREKNPYVKAKSDAKLRGIDFSITKEEYYSIRFLSCYYCHGNLPRIGSGLDRKDNSKGYTIDNVVPCCTDCNLTRNNRYTFEEFKNFIGPALLQVKIHRMENLLKAIIHLPFINNFTRT